MRTKGAILEDLIVQTRRLESQNKVLSSMAMAETEVQLDIRDGLFMLVAAFTRCIELLEEL